MQLALCTQNVIAICKMHLCLNPVVLLASAHRSPEEHAKCLAGEEACSKDRKPLDQHMVGLIAAVCFHWLHLSR